MQLLNTIPSQMGLTSVFFAPRLPLRKINPVDTDNEEVLRELQDVFDTDGRVTHMTRLMSFHPSFLRVCTFL